MSKEFLIGDFLKRIKRPIVLDPSKKYRLVTIKMNHNGVFLRGEKKGSEIKSNMYEVKEGDFILSGIDARNGAFGIIPKELDGAIVTNDFWYFEIDENIISKKLFLQLTATAWFDEICKRGSDGTTQRIRLQKDKFFSQTITLPDIKEQDELLETILSFSNYSDDLIDEINVQNDLIEQLKQSILQEAIQGKLTADWRRKNPKTEPASELLKRIKAEKAQLIKDKKIKKEKPLPPITEEEIPFELPDGWVWCRLGSCSINRDELRKPISQKERERRAKVYDYYGASGCIDKIDNYTHNGSFLLVAEDGSNLRLRATSIAFEVKGKFWVNNHAHTIQFIDSITQLYIQDHINGIDLKPYITGGFQPKLNQANLNRILIALPPLEEQKAIVEKVESIMQKCIALEKEIKTSEANAQMLMQAVLKEAFEK